MTKNSTTMGICSLIPMFAVMVIGVINEWPRLLILILSGAAWIIGIVIISNISSKRDAAHKGEVKWNKDQNELTITARNSYVTGEITIVPEKNISLKYNPAQLTYTSVGVGGVSVGNFDYQEESTSLNSTKTGKYYLNYGGKDSYCPIHKIVLTADLAESARKRASVSKYLIGNTLVLRGSPKMPTSSELSAASSLYNKGSMKSDVIAGNVLLQGMGGKSELTHSECQSILSWLGGK